MLEVASDKINRFGWNRMDAAVKDALCADWCDVLTPYTLDEVRAGIRAVFSEAKGKLSSINEFQVEHQIKLAHARLIAAMPRKAEHVAPSRLTDEEKAARRALVAELMPSLAMPSGQSEAQTRDNINAAKDELGE